MSFYTDKSDPNLHLQYRLVEGSEEVHLQTARAKIDIVETVEFGQALFIDGVLQSAQADEELYHWRFVNETMQSAPSRRRVLILGGGEGCIAREVLRYSDVQEVVQVDWDRDLVNLFRGAYSSWNKNAYEDPRMKVVFQDALEFLQTNEDQFWDVVLVDLLDPDADSLDWMKQILDKVLVCGSVFGVNAGQVKPFQKSLQSCEQLALWLKPKIQARAAVKCYVPSFCGIWCFLMGSQNPFASTPCWQLWEPQESDVLGDFVCNVKNWLDWEAPDS